MFYAENTAIFKKQHFYYELLLLKKETAFFACALEHYFARNRRMVACTFASNFLHPQRKAFWIAAAWGIKRKPCDMFSPWSFRPKQTSSSQIRSLSIALQLQHKIFLTVLAYNFFLSNCETDYFAKINVTHCDETRIKEEKSKQAPSNKIRYHSQRKQISSLKYNDTHPCFYRFIRATTTLKMLRIQLDPAEFPINQRNKIWKCKWDVLNYTK